MVSVNPYYKPDYMWVPIEDVVHMKDFLWVLQKLKLCKRWHVLKSDRIAMNGYWVSIL